MELVTPADHDAGFKEVEIVYRSGKRETIKLTAPPYRRAQEIALQLQQTKDVTCVVVACLQSLATPSVGVSVPDFLNRLTLDSASRIEAIAFALTFGSDFQKKMEAMGELLQQSMASTASEPSLPSSVVVTHLQRFGCFPCPSCDCIIGLDGSELPKSTSETPTSAPLPA